MRADARMLRLQQYIRQCEEYGDLLTPRELEHVVEDVRVLFTPVVANLVELLILRQLPAARERKS